ncbi:hypothetical protein MYSEV_276 [Mythimna separata entomopoxvirus 'L']|uniref:Uncharacterized protein n=1 Tax=Mythimna separata entomopoxvirus 'L' TaxID=1293572 RepID=A0A916KQF0_9POXV|nr:hypothetical protein MYSEV_276 [Mythimna separata entomopoxvirus 'L']CCU56474.1 hypothetical protein MYSEV_276 [Mythimna separata entomopoxvirus 'L']
MNDSTYVDMRIIKKDVKNKTYIKSFSCEHIYENYVMKKIDCNDNIYKPQSSQIYASILNINNDTIKCKNEYPSYATIIFDDKYENNLKCDCCCNKCCCRKIYDKEVVKSPKTKKNLVV